MSKVQISINDDLLSRLDNYADANYLSRSGLISLACSQYLNTSEVMFLVKDMSLAVRKIADNNSVDADTLSKINDFERLCKMIVK